MHRVIHNAVSIDAIIGPDEASQRATNLVGRAARALADHLLGELGRVADADADHSRANQCGAHTQHSHQGKTTQRKNQTTQGRPAYTAELVAGTLVVGGYRMVGE